MKSAFRFSALLVVVCAFLTACGGGGSSSPSTGSSGTGTPSTTTPATSSSNPSTANTNASTSVPQSNTVNVQPIQVTGAPGLPRNILTTSVTICQTGTSTCASIDNIQVDTGSNGLRVLASALPTNFALPAQTSGSGISGECAVFGSGYAWGAVRTADVRMAGQLASSIPIQIIADSTLPTVPTDCANAGPALQTASSLGSNGILGVGLFATDCGSVCESTALPRWYYTCTTGGTCMVSTQPVAHQVTNPVSSFPLDNNGVVIDLPAVADTGAASVSGSLIFGIGTQANNTLSGTSVLKANASTGYVTTTSGGQTYAVSYLDSGSNGLFFGTSQFTLCGVWYCPTSTQTASASITGTDGTSSTVSFEVANSTTIFASSNNAFDNLAGASNQGFSWGLPFFYGRRVYTAIASRDTPAGPGPYYAF